MTLGNWLLQAAYLTGFIAFPLAGAKSRKVKRSGWLVALASEGWFAGWATVTHVPGAYPWIAAWGGVYLWNILR